VWGQGRDAPARPSRPAGPEGATPASTGLDGNRPPGHARALREPPTVVPLPFKQHRSKPDGPHSRTRTRSHPRQERRRRRQDRWPRPHRRRTGTARSRHGSCQGTRRPDQGPQPRQQREGAGLRGRGAPVRVHHRGQGRHRLGDPHQHRLPHRGRRQGAYLEREASPIGGGNPGGPPPEQPVPAVVAVPQRGCRFPDDPLLPDDRRNRRARHVLAAEAGTSR
jgi:hypothetical protein